MPHAPAPESTADPSSELDPTDPKAVWAALLQRVQGQRSLAWLRFLQIEQIEEQRVVLGTVPGRRDVIGFCTDERLAQIGTQLAPLLGRRVRVTLQRPEQAAGQAEPADADSGEAPSRQASGAARGNKRREAMGLPVVQRALEAFPDATLIGVRDESELTTPPANAQSSGEPGEAAANHEDDNDEDDNDETAG